MHATIGLRAWRGLTQIAGVISAMLLIVLAPAATAQTTGTITGRVSDLRLAAPLEGAVIDVDGTRLGATTGADGRFRITGVPAGSRLVIARRLGFGAVRKTVTVIAGSEATADFGLEAAAVSLDEVVVTGTAGGELRRSIGNAVSRIDASDELAKSAATNVTSLLNARAPSLSVQT